jgi:arylsulfatase A-like enzyme
LSAAELSQLGRLYEGELRRTDTLVRAILEVVDASSDPKHTLVFLLSDHGDNLGDHDHLGHVFNLYDSNLRIALLARGPGFPAGSVERRPAHITDLYPTILGAAGLEVEAGVAGIDLRRDLPAARLLAAQLDFPVYVLSVFPRSIVETGVLRPYERGIEAAIDGRLKLIRGSDGTAELYDLLADPGETRPLPADGTDGAALERLHAFLDDAGSPAVPSDEAAEALDARTTEALRALGYAK